MFNLYNVQYPTVCVEWKLKRALQDMEDFFYSKNNLKYVVWFFFSHKGK